MDIVIHNPTDGIYAATDDYVHAIEVRNPARMLFVAGTIGLDAQGVAGTSLEHQLELVWSNLRTILAGAGMTVDNIVRLTSYLRDAAYVEANGAAGWRPGRPPHPDHGDHCPDPGRGLADRAGDHRHGVTGRLSWPGPA